MDFNLRCFTFSLYSQEYITFLILFSEVLIFLVGDNEGKDKTYDYYRTEKFYVKCMYMYELDLSVLLLLCTFFSFFSSF